MRIEHTPPPNYDEIKRRLNVNFDDGLVFTYGDTIYTKRTDLLPDVIIHEQVHIKQQALSPSVWWNMYLNDWTFRYTQELEAYREQAKFIKKYILDRNARYKCISEVAQDFASPIYGPIISYDDAIKLLTR